MPEPSDAPHRCVGVVVLINLIVLIVVLTSHG
jgi:hypothetical protein